VKVSLKALSAAANAPAAGDDSEQAADEYIKQATVQVGFVIAKSTPNYAEALTTAKTRKIQKIGAAYLEEEVTVLRELLASATGTNRLRFTGEHRRRLALAGKR
jgi:hypothetical protein